MTGVGKGADAARPAAGGGDERRAAGLTAAVAALGVRGRIEARGRLAVLHAEFADGEDDARALADVALRERLTAAAAECGFTHLALELPAPAAAHSTSGAGDAGDARAHLRRA